MLVISPLKIDYKGETKPAHVAFEIDETDLPSLLSKGATVIKPAKAPEAPQETPSKKSDKSTEQKGE